MFCEISEAQQAIIKKLVGSILKRTDSYSKTPERIIKEVYDITYEQFVKAGPIKDSKPMMKSLQMALYASSILREVLLSEDTELRRKVREIAKIEDKYSPEYFDKLVYLAVFLNLLKRHSLKLLRGKSLRVKHLEEKRVFGISRL